MARRKIEVQILGDSRSLQDSFRKAERSARGFGSRIGGIARTVSRASALISGAGLAATLAVGTKEFAQQQKVAAQTAAAIKSTAGAAGVTAKQIDNLASSMLNLSGIDDEVVKAGENVLLSFTNIRNQAGKGNDIFTQATKAAVDFAARTGRDVPQAALLFGKALEDPARKVSALARAGIVFSQSQIKTITALQKSGKLMEAQKIVLAELTKRYGGAAKAAGGTLAGQLSKLRETFRNVAGDIVSKFAPALAGALDSVNKFVSRLSDARTVHAKLNVVFDTLVDAGRSIQNRIGDAVAAVDFDAVWARARGIGDGLQKRLEEIDFAGVGRRIGKGIADAVKFAIPAVADLAARITKAFTTIRWDEVGASMGPGLITAVLSAFNAILDPAFWIKNWKLAASVLVNAALLVVPQARLAKVGEVIVLKIAGSIERFAPRLALALLTPLKALGGLAEGAILGAASVIERAFGRVGTLAASALISALLRLPRLVARTLDPLVGIVTRKFNRLSGLAKFTLRVLGLTAVIDAVTALASNVLGAFKRLAVSVGHSLDSAWKRIKEQASQAVSGIVDPFTRIPDLVGRALASLARTVAGVFSRLGDAASFTVKVLGLDQAVSAVGDAFAQIGRFADRLVAPFARVGGQIIGVIASGIGQSASKVGDTLSSALAGLAGLVAGALAPLTRIVSGAFERLEKLASFTVKVLGIQAAIDAVADLGKRIGSTIKGTLDGLLAFVKQWAVQLALRIVEPFSHLPSFLGSKAKAAKRALEAELAGMGASAAATSKTIRTAFATLGDGPFKGLAGALQTQLNLMEAASLTTAQAISDAFIAKLQPAIDLFATLAAGLKPVKGRTATAAITKETTTRATKETTTLAKTISEASVDVAGIAKASKIVETAAEKAKRGFDHVLDGLQVALEKAQATPFLKDDLKRVNDIIIALRGRAKVAKEDLDVQHQLVAALAQQRDLLAQQKTIKQQQLKTTQFKKLGLGPTGEDLVPNTRSLSAQLKRVSDAVKGTFLDKDKTRGVLASIRSVLKGHFGTIGDEVKGTIKAMLDNVDQQLRDHAGTGTATKTTALSANKVLSGLGLDPTETKKLRARLAKFNSAGVSLARTGGPTAFGMSLAGAGAPIVIHNLTTLDGHVLERTVTTHQQKRRRRNPSQKRGPHAGGV